MLYMISGMPYRAPRLPAPSTGLHAGWLAVVIEQVTDEKDRIRAGLLGVERKSEFAPPSPLVEFEAGTGDHGQRP